MYILFQSRPDLLENVGGDTIQILKTKQALESLGNKVDIDSRIDKKLKSYDIVHIFNLQNTKYTYQLVLNAKKQGKKIALSTIWWDFKYVWDDKDVAKYAVKFNNVLLSDYIPLTAIKFINKKGHYLLNIRRHRKIKEILNAVDVILPNSVAELEILVSELEMPNLRKKSCVVYNAISLPKFCNDDNKLNIPDNCVMTVGRIEPIKGQLKVIKALMNRKEIPIVFIGRGIESPYGQACQNMARARGNVYFISEVKHEEIDKYYKYAKVHALVSLRESPGLASLEAAVNGANVVTSIHAPICEYFKTLSHVCDPNDLIDIEKKIITAWKTSRNDELRSFIMDNFTWKNTGLQTQDAYKMCMGCKDVSK